jgi:hypothetical protein
LTLSIALDFPAWLVWCAGIALAVFGLWTGLVVFILVTYPRNRARYVRIIAAAYQKLDSPWVRWILTDDGFTVESRTTRRRSPGRPSARRLWAVPSGS